MGKTQLAAEFARKYHGKYSAVFWLDGFSEDQLKQSFLNVARILPQDEDTAVLAGGLRDPNVDVDAVVKGFLRWLSLSSNRRWLLIIDNMDRGYHNKVRDPQAYDVKDYLPSADRGSILVTSRLASLERYGAGLKLDRLDDKQAKVVLESNAGKTTKGEWRS